MVGVKDWKIGKTPPRTHLREHFNEPTKEELKRLRKVRDEPSNWKQRTPFSSNISKQMMVKHGYVEGQGLGSDEQGLKTMDKVLEHSYPNAGSRGIGATGQEPKSTRVPKVMEFRTSSPTRDAHESKVGRRRSYEPGIGWSTLFAAISQERRQQYQAPAVLRCKYNSRSSSSY